MSSGSKNNWESFAPSQPGSGSQRAPVRPHKTQHLHAPWHEVCSAQEMVAAGSLDWLLLTLREFVLVLDSKGAIEMLWTSNQSLHQRSQAALLGRRLEDILQPGPFGQLSKIFQRAIQTGQNHDLQYSIDIAGGVRWFMLRVAPTVNAGGGAATLCLSSRDNTERIKHDEKLRQSEALLGHAEEIAKMGSWEFDLKTKEITLSTQLLRMYGVASEVEWSEDAYWARIHPDDREQARGIVDRAFAECKPFEYVSRYLNPGFEVRVHFIRGLPIPGPDKKTVRAIGIVQDITDQARTETELRRLSHQLLRARDEGHRRVARELHESAGQSLAALKMTLGRLRDFLPRQDLDTGQLLRSAAALADAAIREVRTVSYVMHPPLLDHAGLGPALRWYADGFSQRSGIAVLVEVPDDFGRCSQETETTVFRIVQEALTNVHRHSGSHTATIRLFREERHIVAEVHDEGCGLQPSARDRTQHAPYGVGIAGMRERVKHLDGAFKILSDSGHGTTVRAILPLSAPVTQARFHESHGSV